jgi:hypothetical protein
MGPKLTSLQPWRVRDSQQAVPFCRSAKPVAHDRQTTTRGVTPGAEKRQTTQPATAVAQSVVGSAWGTAPPLVAAVGVVNSGAASASSVRSLGIVSCYSLGLLCDRIKIVITLNNPDI